MIDYSEIKRTKRAIFQGNKELENPHFILLITMGEAKKANPLKQLLMNECWWWEKKSLRNKLTGFIKSFDAQWVIMMLFRANRKHVFDQSDEIDLVNEKLFK